MSTLYSVYLLRKDFNRPVLQKTILMKEIGYSIYYVVEKNRRVDTMSNIRLKRNTD